MTYKKHLGGAAPYLATGIALKDKPEWAFATIITVFIGNKIYNYLMRNHRITSDKYIDHNGNPRETTFSENQ